MKENNEKRIYNYERKKKFIESYEGGLGENWLMYLFIATASDEKFLNKDIADFSEREILDTLKGMFSTSVGTLEVRTSVLRTYAAWCECNNLLATNMNCFNSITLDDIKGCVNKEVKEKKYITRERLYKYCDELINPADKFTLLAFYEGLKGKQYSDIAHLTINDLHKNFFTLEDRNISVPEKLYDYAMQAATTTDYISMKEGTFMTLQLLQCPNVIKPRNNAQNFDDAASTYNCVQKRLWFVKNYLDATELTTNNLFYSGLISYMEEIAKEKKVDILDVIELPEFEALKEKYNLMNKKPFTIRSIIKKYL